MEIRIIPLKLPEYTLRYTLNGHNIYNQEVTEYKESPVLAGQSQSK